MTDSEHGGRHESTTRSRRDVLCGIGTAAAVGLAGCSTPRGSIGDRDIIAYDNGSEAWPTGGFDVANSGFNPAIELLSTSRQSTQITHGGAGIDAFYGAGAAVAEDRLYFGTLGGDIVCTRTTGDRQWRTEIDRGAGVRSTPLVTREVVYVSSPNGMAALDVTDGEKLWQSDVWGWRSSPALTDGNLYGVGTGPSVVALDPETGRQEWRVKTHLISSLSAAEGTVYAVGANRDEGVVSAIADGDLLWSRADFRGIYARPTVADTVVLVCTTSGRLYALDRETGDTVWTHQRNGSGSTTPAIAHGQVYLSSGNGTRTTCLDLASGEVQWRLETGVFHGQPVAVADGVYFGTPNEGLFAVAPDGTIKWHDERFRVEGAMAAVADGLYVIPFVGPFGSGDLYSIANASRSE